MTWITQALNAGGTLTVKQLLPNRTIFCGRMDWTGEEPVIGGVGMSLESALVNLEKCLMEDAAREQMQGGTV